ncbi:MAG: DUF2207 domain-containing protein [Actinomycetota bacterium]
MGYQSRRWVDRILIGGAGLVFGGVGAIAAAGGDGERITRYAASATVDETGQAAVAEVIEFDFGPSERRGIFRDVPGLEPDAPITVESATAPDQFIVEPFGFETRVRIGDPNVTISGRHRYAINYPVDVGQKGNRISWNAVGADWDVGMSNVELSLAAGNELLDVRCSSGETGTWDGCTAEQPEPGLLVVTVDSLSSNEGVTISALRGDPLGAAPANPALPDLAAEDPGTGVLAPAAAALVAALGAGSAVSVATRRAGRELIWAGGAADAAYGPRSDEEYPVRVVDQAELSQLASTEFAPPNNISAWQGGILFAEKLTADHKVAWLLERAITNEVAIEGTEDDLTLRRLTVDTPNGALLDGLFGGRNSVHLGTYDKQFAAGWSSLGDELGRWLDHSPYWDPTGDQRRKRAIGFGIPLLILGIVGTIVFSVVANRVGVPWLAGVLLGGGVAGAGYAMLQRAWELRVRTPAGSGMWILIESFRRFINGSDAQHVSDAARRGVLLDYTAWAVALDEVDRWSDAIKSADLDDTIAPQAIYYSNMAPHLAVATLSAATAPSSSGGGGGGGSVGGGGGGGGGGSW